MKELYLKLRVNLGLVTMWSFDVSHSAYLESASQASPELGWGCISK